MDRLTFAPVVGLGPASAVTTSAASTCAILVDHTVWCWGSNLRGELGNGGATASAVPVPVAGISPTAPGPGYATVRSDGWVQTFGSYTSRGDLPRLGVKPALAIVGAAETPSGNGYWMVASDGGIFAFGDAQFHGSTGSMTLNKPIVGMAATPTGNGYWLVASDGGIFAFGDAQFHGSTGSIPLVQPITAMSATASGNGYRLVATDGGVFNFGDATSSGADPLPEAHIVALLS